MWIRRSSPQSLKAGPYRFDHQAEAFTNPGGEKAVIELLQNIPISKLSVMKGFVSKRTDLRRFRCVKKIIGFSYPAFTLC
jgi:hypothetical protein